jgi:hypothetical protein
MVERNMSDAVMRGIVVPPSRGPHHAHKASCRAHGSIRIELLIMSLDDQASAKQVADPRLQLVIDGCDHEECSREQRAHGPPVKSDHGR